MLSISRHLCLQCAPVVSSISISPMLLGMLFSASALNTPWPRLSNPSSIIKKGPSSVAQFRSAPWQYRDRLQVF
ncbi:hypothetical protein F5Y15DRAFT_366601 [Xylariaceae sp. FL0016]|nr:hypothetical protein F5Y15DRAFT_366601 [Xylariaceae sp. FL0016]